MSDKIHGSHRSAGPCSEPWTLTKHISIRAVLVLAYAALLYVLGFVLNSFSSDTASIAALTGFPILYGAFVQSMLDPRRVMPGHDVFAWGLLPLGVLIFGLLLVGLETLICIAIAVLPFLTLMVLGLWLMRLLLGKLLSRDLSREINSSLLLLPFTVVPFLESLSFPERAYSVVTDVVIHAPANIVWDKTVEISMIQADERIWTFSHNVLQAPQPIDAVVDGHIRQLRWTKGVRFQEHLTHVIEQRFLSWNFVFNEKETLRQLDPHISPSGEMVNLQRGSYSLKPLGQGATRLSLVTHYRLKSPINTYLGWWGEVFLQDFHNSVLVVIKERAERYAASINSAPRAPF